MFMAICLSCTKFSNVILWWVFFLFYLGVFSRLLDSVSTFKLAVYFKGKDVLMQNMSLVLKPLHVYN